MKYVFKVTFENRDPIYMNLRWSDLGSLQRKAEGHPEFQQELQKAIDDDNYRAKYFESMMLSLN